MAKQTVNIGTAPNDGTGDQLRDAYDKLNQNFDEVYLAGPVGTNIQVGGNVILSTDLDGNIEITPDGNGTIQLSKDVNALGDATIIGQAFAADPDGIDQQGLVTVAYYDANLPAGGGGSYTNWSITDGVTTEDLDDGDTLTVSGTVNQVDVVVSVTDTLTIGLPDDVTITDSLTVTGLAILDGGIQVDTTNFTVDGTTGALSTTSTINAGGLATVDSLTVTNASDFNGLVTVGSMTFDAASVFDAGANKLTNLADPTVPQDAATQAYVDNIADTGWILTDGVTPQTIAGGDTLTVSGTVGEVNVAVSVTDTLTIGLPDNVTIAGSLQVAGGAFQVEPVSGNANTTGTFEVSETLLVSGVATFTEAVRITGGTEEQFIIEDGAAGITFTVDSTTGNTDIEGTLDVTASLDVIGDTTINANFTMVGGGEQSFIINDGAATTFSVDPSTGNTVIGGTLDVTGEVSDITFAAASDIDIGANKLTNLADPTLAQDAATQAYVLAAGTAGWTLTDGSTPTTIATGTAGDTLTVSGTTNEVDVVTGVDTLTISLPDAVSVTTSITAPTVSTDDLTIPSPSVPGTAGATGTTGQIAWDAGFIYVCVATDTWVRAAIATWV